MFDLAGSIPASQLCYACFILGNADGDFPSCIKTKELYKTRRGQRNLKLFRKGYSKLKVFNWDHQSLQRRCVLFSWYHTNYSFMLRLFILEHADSVIFRRVLKPRRFIKARRGQRNLTLFRTGYSKLRVLTTGDAPRGHNPPSIFKVYILISSLFNIVVVVVVVTIAV